MKNLMMGIFAAVAAVVMCGCSQRSTLTDNKFIVGFDAEFPPYGFKDGNEYKGFDLDLAREVCKRRGWEFVACPINWDAKDMQLNSAKIDCIWNGFTMQGREANYTWSPAYVDNSQVVIVKAGSAIKKLADLAGKVVAVQTDTPVQKALMAGGDKEAIGKTFKELRTTADYNSAVMALESGAVDAVALDIGVAEKKMADMPGKFVKLSEIVMTETYGIGFKLGNEELRDKVVETFREMVKDGSAAAISGKWFNGENHIILK
jgi:polar amino acid transport system substrate-binding protein